jgi:hypothetical protein
MKVRIYSDYDPIRILKGITREADDALALKLGLTGTFVEVEETEIPSDRSNRDCWVHKNGKVEVDSVKLQAKEAKKAEKEGKKNSILSKLKITEEEFKDLIG